MNHYQSKVVTRAYAQCKTFQSPDSITVENLKPIIANIIWNDLLLDCYNVWSLLEKTGDKEYTEQSFNKAADLVIGSNIATLNVIIEMNKNDRS